jgi:hypothetical protein
MKKPWIQAAVIALPLAAALSGCAPKPSAQSDLARELTGFGEDQPSRPNVSGSGNDSRSGDH